MSQAAHSLGPTFPLSIVTRLADPVRRQLFPTDAVRAMKLAERLTSLHDYDGGSLRQRLDETIETVLRTDWNALGRFALRYILNWHLSNRLRVVELLEQQRPLEVIEAIYNHFGLPFDGALDGRLGARIAEEPTAQSGEHDYDIRDYGLNEDQI